MHDPDPPPSRSRLREAFDALAELTAAERHRRLAEIAVEDEALHHELRSLLAVHDRAGSFLEESPLAALAPRLDPDAVNLVGERLGDYRVVEPLGRGGMGAVFLAERADGAYEQTVAVKLLDHVQSDELSVQRFEGERQTLAKLSHPNIARLLDGGTTADGKPFLVLEYVDGEHLDTWCDRRRLGVVARLRLFLQVCAGVEHAHRHLVVHRDLKPGNILVTAEGTVKLLDFGIAKLLGELDAGDEPEAGSHSEAGAELLAGTPGRRPRSSRLPLTAAGATAFTPGYASPEQLRGEPVSAASDVYALGLVLYELLCGRRPPDGGAAPGGGTRPHEVPPPSEALRRPQPPGAPPGEEVAEAADEEAAEAVADRRGTTVPRLRRRLRGDLDAILVKALAADEGSRYASAGDLGRDLERHLAHHPVAARAGEPAYAARKLVRRHRVGFAAAALVLLSLIAGLATTTWQAARAERAQAAAERRFEQVQELARSLLFEVHDAVARLPGATPARHLLVDRALTYLDALRAEAGDDLGLQRELADAYERIGDIQGNPHQSNLGDTEAAERSYRQALALRLAQPEDVRRRAPMRAAIAGTHHRIGEVLWWTGDVEAAAEQLQGAVAVWEELAEEAPEEPRWALEQARSLTTLARVESWNGEHEVALARLDEAEDLLLPLLAAPLAAAAEEARALVHQGRGETLGWMGESDRGIAELRRARDELARLSAARPLDAPLRRRLYLASLRHCSLLADRSMAESAACFPATLELARELADADPADARARRDLSLAHAAFGDVLSEVGRPAEALEHFREAQRLQRRLAAEDPNNLGHQADLANSAVRIGYLLDEQGDHRAALESFGEALDLRRPLLAADPEDAANRRDVAVIHSARGDTLSALDRREAACDAYGESLLLWQELDRSGLLREYDRPQLDHAAAGKADACTRA